MKKLLIINKKVNFFEKKKILLNIKYKNQYFIDFRYEENRPFYEDQNISAKIIKSNLLVEKNFLFIKSYFEKKINEFLKENPNFIKYKFSEINFSDFWWRLIVDCELINNFVK